MMQPTWVTWALILFGAVTLLPLFVAQSLILLRPSDQRTRDLLIGKGEQWRDETHFRLARGGAWADLLLLCPLFAVGSVGMILEFSWGYLLFGAAGACSLYINVILRVVEKEYVYPMRGWFRYYTYYWGFFVYWGALALLYAVIRIAGVSL